MSLAVRVCYFLALIVLSAAAWLAPVRWSRASAAAVIVLVGADLILTWTAKRRAGRRPS